MLRAPIAVLVLSAALGAAPRASIAAGLPFEKIAQDFLAHHGMKDTPREKVDFAQVLAAHFVHGRFGQFEVYFPVDGLESSADDLKSSAVALLDAHARWLDWVKPLGLDQKPVRKDLDVVTAWVKKANPAVLARANDAAGKDILEMLSIPESVAAASGRLSDAMGRCAPIGPPRTEVLVTKLILIPDRRSFVEMICFIGWLDPELRKLFWADNVADWTQSFYQDWQLVALQYAAAGRAAGEYTQGSSMNEKDALVMEQQVVQLGMNFLFDHQYGERVPKAFIGGLSMNLVIDQFENISTKIDGDLRERSVAAREIFIPGATSDGFLPPQSAETRWREDRGRDHFVRILNLTQQEGDGLEKKAKNRLACFAIRSDNGGSKMAMVAPFLGHVAVEAKPPPEEFRGEFMEFLRAYKCGFIYWLKEKAGGTEKGSHEKFAQLLQRLSDAQRAGDFEAVFRDIYDGAALSDVDASKTTLEGKFLIWLSKQ
jgi:hypothetical protein